MFINVHKKLSFVKEGIEFEWKKERETEKAIKVITTATFGSRSVKREAWIPKSAIEILDDGWVAVESWVPAAKGIPAVEIIRLPEYQGSRPAKPKELVEALLNGMATVQPAYMR